MRAILCLQPAGQGADAGRPGDTAWPPPVLAAWAAGVARWEVEPSGDLYADLGDAAADAWDETVATAQALLAAARAAAPTLDPGGAGLAPGRFAAACAARLARPGTLRAIAPDRAAAALAPLPVAWLPGLSAPRLRDLRDLRLFTLGDLAALPAPLVVAVFGAAFAPLQALAAGRDPRPIAPGHAIADCRPRSRRSRRGRRPARSPPPTSTASPPGWPRRWPPWAARRRHCC